MFVIFTLAMVPFHEGRKGEGELLSYITASADITPSVSTEKLLYSYFYSGIIENQFHFIINI